MTYRQMIILSFFLNGLLALGNKLVSILGLSRQTVVILACLYGVGAFGCLVYMLAERKPISRRSVAVGLMAGLSSPVAMASGMSAAGLIPGYIVFPLIGGGTLVIVALIGRVVFGEKIGAFGIAGIIAGIAAMYLLSG